MTSDIKHDGYTNGEVPDIVLRDTKGGKVTIGSLTTFSECMDLRDRIVRLATAEDSEVQHIARRLAREAKMTLDAEWGRLGYETIGRLYHVERLASELLGISTQSIEE